MFNGSADLFYEVERKPLSLFRKHKLPIGIVRAFKNRHGYDPLRVWRIYSVVRFIHDGAAYLLVLTIIMPLAALISPEISLADLGELPFLSFTLACAVIVLLTHRWNKRLAEKAEAFSRGLADFYRRFLWPRSANGSALPGNADEDTVRGIVDETMVHITHKILLHEATGETDAVAGWRNQRGEAASIANQMGLGRDWKTYIDMARKKYSLYEFFVWEI